MIYYLHTVPEWKGKLKERFGQMNLKEAIDQCNPEIKNVEKKYGAFAVKWSIETFKWEVVDAVKVYLDEKLKDIKKGSAFSHTGTRKHSNKYRNHFK